MSSRTKFDALLDADIVEPNDETGGLQLVSEFRRTVEERTAQLDGRDEASLRREIRRFADGERETELLCQHMTDDLALLALYETLREQVTNISRVEALLTAVVLNQNKPLRSDGVPEVFIPVRGLDLPRIVGLCQRCLVYAWREECPPCDAVRESFDKLFADESPADLVTVAVYGPDYAELLERDYDIVGAPTILFTLDGQIDSRLVGETSQEAIAHEIRVLRNRSTQNE